MFPELFKIGSIPINSYGTMVLLGVIGGLWLLNKGSVRRGWNPDESIDIAIWTVFAGIVGGRIFYVIQFWSSNPVFIEDPWFGPFKIWKGGLVLFGGLMGGLLCMLFLTWRRRKPVLEFLDVAAPSAAVGVAVGRIGCLLNGCCWGKVCHEDFALGISYPAGAPAAHTLPVHPTQLYSFVALLVVAWICWRLGAHRPPRGTVIGTLAILYGICRYTVETIRGDHDPAPGEWTVSQQLSMCVVLIGLSLLSAAAIRSRRGRTPAPASA